ncbi:MAG: hypothetical protein HOP25_03290 [Methylotenera sp.]|nr:hypothetical protein [Methylotenera sp.]
MKLLNTLTLAAVLFALSGCSYFGTKADNKAYYSPQKILKAVSDKYPTEKADLIYIGAPVGFIAPRENNNEVSSGADAGKVVDIITALTVKTSKIVITGTDNTLTAITLERALTAKNSKISGGNVIYVGATKAESDNLSKLAQAAGVNIEFMDLPS